VGFEDEAKKAWASLTLWFNTVVLPLIFTFAAFAPELTEQLPVLKTYMPDNLYKWAFIASIVGNVILRFRTKSAISI